MITKLEIEKIYNSIIENKNLSVGIDKISPKAAKKNGFDKDYIDRVFNAINGKPYKFTKYKQLLQIKNSKKLPRIISIPCLRDRLLFKTLYELFLKNHVKRFKFERVVKQIHDDASGLKYNRVAKFDIQSFFDSVPHNLLKQSLIDEGVDNIVVNLLMKSVRVRTVREDVNIKETSSIDSLSDKGIPQGIIVGNALAEIFAQQFDKDFLQLESKGLIKYHRFVDDILIFYNSETMSDDKLNTCVESILSRYCLMCQKDKVQLGLDKYKGFEFLGFVFRGSSISVSKAVLLKKEKGIERVIFDFAKSTHSRIKNNYDYLTWKLNLEITGFISNSIFYGWTSSYRFINDYNVFRRLDFTMSKIYKRANLDINEYSKIKSFLKSHNCIKKARNNKTNYIPNFDVLFPTNSEKRDFLKKIYGITSTISVEHINSLFNDIVKKEIYNIERDLDLKYGI